MSKLVTREKKVAFMGCVAESKITYNRMRHFTSLSRSSNPNEYSRKYVDEAGENTDVTGYAPSIAYAFDQYMMRSLRFLTVKRSETMQSAPLSMWTSQNPERRRGISSQPNAIMQLFQIQTVTTRTHIRIPVTSNQNLIKRRLRLLQKMDGLHAKL